MAKAKITLFGLYEYGKTTGDYDLFDGITLPAGMDKDVLIGNIIHRGGEFEVLYAEPTFYKMCINNWMAKWTPTIERWWRALNLEYNPLENYDRQEDWRDDTTRNKDNITDFNELRTATDESGQDTSGSTEGKVSAFDESTYQPSEKSEVSSKSNTSGLTFGSTGSKTSDKETGIEMSGHSGRIHGNIGVTTSQQMLQSELDIARFNIYDEITNLFLTELTIYTY